MNTAVRYYTRSGNTKKLADAVAEAISAESLEVKVPLDGETDILFLCCSYYAFDVDEAVKEFIIKNKGNIGKIVCVGTSAMMKSMKKPISKVVKGFGITVAQEEFHCRGQFMKVHKGRPDMGDLKKVADFAKKIIAE